MTVVVPIGSAKPAAEARPERVGVLLVNLGTPDAADAKGVRRYLKEFLSDPRVIEDQGLVWKLILNGIILRTRPAAQGARLPEDLEWREERIAAEDDHALAGREARRGDRRSDHVVVDWAMRYGNPSIASRIEALTAQGCDRLLVVPLYPQYSAATTATVCDEVFRVLAGMRAQPALRVVPPYYDEPVYIEALAVSIKRIWRRCRSSRS